MTGIIDYGSGNLRSVYNAFKYLGEDVKILGNPEGLMEMDKLVLPGVGSCKDAVEELEKRDLAQAIKAFIKKGNPFLGICLGLQLLFSKSAEGGGVKCFNLLAGEVRLFPKEKGIKVPQIGWNKVKYLRKDCPLFKGIEDNSYFYFVHSYYCANNEKEYTLSETEYGINFTSGIFKDNIFAFQFHPERSQKNGLKILENFIGL